MGECKALQYGVGQGRNLYYYPKGTGMVVGVDPDAKVWRCTLCSSSPIFKPPSYH